MAPQVSTGCAGHQSVHDKQALSHRRDKDAGQKGIWLGTSGLDGTNPSAVRLDSDVCRLLPYTRVTTLHQGTDCIS